MTSDKPLKLNRILVLYKRSAYESYIDARRSLRLKGRNDIVEKELKYFKEAYLEHYASLRLVLKTLKSFGLSCVKRYRGQRIDYKPFDFIITVGGDGTFLEAARHIKDQIILGVNSAPRYSVGRYCMANPKNFRIFMEKILKGRVKIHHFYQLSLNFPQSTQPVYALNDILVCHPNPATMSRYYLKIEGQEEQQRSSGLWVSTASGSTAAIRSAGGKVMSKYDEKIQYQPRELHYFKANQYRLTGGILPAGKKINIISLMHEGRIYVDGDHLSFPFPYGAGIKIQNSLKPITTISIS